MCDPVYCAGLDCGPPLVALDALRSLASTLNSMRMAQVGSAFSGETNPEEADVTPTIAASHAVEPLLRRQPEPPACGATEPGGDRDPCGIVVGYQSSSFQERPE